MAVPPRQSCVLLSARNAMYPRFHIISNQSTLLYLLSAPYNSSLQHNVTQPLPNKNSRRNQSGAVQEAKGILRKRYDGGVAAGSRLSTLNEWSQTGAFGAAAAFTAAAATPAVLLGRTCSQPEWLPPVQGEGARQGGFSACCFLNMPLQHGRSARPLVVSTTGGGVRPPRLHARHAFPAVSPLRIHLLC